MYLYRGEFVTARILVQPRSVQRPSLVESTTAIASLVWAGLEPLGLRGHSILSEGADPIWCVWVKGPILFSIWVNP